MIQIIYIINFVVKISTIKNYFCKEIKYQISSLVELWKAPLPGCSHTASSTVVFVLKFDQDATPALVKPVQTSLHNKFGRIAVPKLNKDTTTKTVSTEQTKKSHVPTARARAKPSLLSRSAPDLAD